MASYAALLEVLIRAKNEMRAQTTQAGADLANLDRATKRTDQTTQDLNRSVTKMKKEFLLYSNSILAVTGVTSAMAAGYAKLIGDASKLAVEHDKLSSSLRVSAKAMSEANAELIVAGQVAGPQALRVMRDLNVQIGALKATFMGLGVVLASSVVTGIRAAGNAFVDWFSDIPFWGKEITFLADKFQNLGEKMTQAFRDANEEISKARIADILSGGVASTDRMMAMLKEHEARRRDLIAKDMQSARDRLKMRTLDKPADRKSFAELGIGFKERIPMQRMPEAIEEITEKITNAQVAMATFIMDTQAGFENLGATMIGAVESFADGWGDAMARVVVFHESFSKSMKDLWKQFAAMVIAEINRIIARLIIAAVFQGFLSGTPIGKLLGIAKQAASTVSGFGGVGSAGSSGVPVGAAGDTGSIAFAPLRRSAGMSVNVTARTVFGTREEAMTIGRQIAAAMASGALR